MGQRQEQGRRAGDGPPAAAVYPVSRAQFTDRKVINFAPGQRQAVQEVADRWFGGNFNECARAAVQVGLRVLEQSRETEAEMVPVPEGAFINRVEVEHADE